MEQKDISANPRQHYLFKTLGLSHDPFTSPVTEQEFHRYTAKAGHQAFDQTTSPFLSYYTNPQTTNSDKPIYQELRQAKHSFVFGQPGSGKTMLRYVLEAECRSTDDQTLVVTYELSDRTIHSLSPEKHWRRLAQELATDLFIQILEKLETLEKVTEAQKDVFQNQMAFIWQRRLRRTVQLIAEAATDTDLSLFWPRLGRPSIRYTRHTQKIRHYLQESIQNISPVQDNISGEASLKVGIAAAKIWGFKRIFVLVDGVDAYHRKPADMMALISPLLKPLHRWQDQGLFFHFFLTSEMQEIINFKGLKNLPFPPISYIITWGKEELANLLQERFRSAGGRIPGLDVLSSGDFKTSLTEHIIEASQYSPRRLLYLISALIDAHAHRAPEEFLLTPNDWCEMQKTWGYGDPPPPDLPEPNRRFNLSP